MQGIFGSHFPAGAAPYLVRVRQHDGSLRNLPNSFAGPAPPDGAKIPIEVGDGIIVARVEAHSQCYSVSPDNPEVQIVDVVTVTEVREESVS